MKTFKCVLVRSQYQTVEVVAKDYAEAKENAWVLFDPQKPTEQYIEVYDIEEVPTKEKENV